MKLTSHERETIREALGRVADGFYINDQCPECDEWVDLDISSVEQRQTVADRIIDELDKAGFDLVKR